MSQVLVWKSDQDGKLFEDKTKYQKHLRKLAGFRLQERKVAAAKVNRESFFDKMGQVSSIVDLETFIKDNWDWFFFNGVQSNCWRRAATHVKKHEHVEVKFTDMFRNEIVSNSHSHPRTGFSNWSGEPDRPRGYPGWQGNIQIRVRTPQEKYKGKLYSVDGFGSGYFEDTPINTGSGGGGSETNGITRYRYDVKLFADDFPGLARAYSKAKVLNILSDQSLDFA